MSYIRPAALEARRKYWTRHDAWRFAPPGTPETKMPGWLDPSATRVRLQEAQEDEPRAEMDAELSALRASHERVRQLLAQVKYELAWRRLCRKYGYNPNQPRVPAGNPDGGQWTNGVNAAGNAATLGKPEVANELVTEDAALRRGGHHYIPRAVYKNRRLSDEARKVFEETTTGRLEDKRLNVFSSSHRAYNKAVNEEFDRFLTKNNITEEQITPDHARQLLSEIVASRDPRIRNFNMRIWMRQLFRGGRLRGNE